MSRACKTGLITQSKEWAEFVLPNSPPLDLSLNWLMRQISQHLSESEQQIKSLNSQFNVDTEDTKTKTPRRNVAIQEAEDFATRLRQWCGWIRLIFIGDSLREIEENNNPAKPTPATSTASVQQLLEVKSQYSLFNPILPLMEEREPNDDDADNCNRNTGEENMNMLLAATDTSKLLDEQVQTLTRACGDIKSTWPEASEHMLLTSAEATLSLICRDLMDLSDQYTDTLNYIESMMEMQLIAAIGKRLTSKDLDAFVKYHNARLLSPSPLPFSHAVRRPEHYPGKPSFCNSSNVPINELTVAW